MFTVVITSYVNIVHGGLWGDEGCVESVLKHKSRVY